MKNKTAFRLTLIFFLLINALAAPQAALFAQHIPGSEVRLSFHPDVPVVGLPWTLALQVDYPDSEKVTVTARFLPPSLFLDSVSKSLKVIPGAAPQTLIEYRFIPGSPGSLHIEPFAVLSPEGTTMTVPLNLNVQMPAAGAQPLRPRVFWEGVPPRLVKGQSIVFSLRTYGSYPIPFRDFFEQVIPQGVIIESLELSQEERDTGFILKLRLIPLEAAPVYLPALALRHGDILLEVPALNIQVDVPPAPPLIIEITAYTGAEEEVFYEIGKSFPPIELVLYRSRASPGLIAEFEVIYNAAGDLWEQGRYAQALAKLRRNERDHNAGSLLRPIRREAENTLGFNNTRDENRGTRRWLVFFTAISFFFATISRLVCFLLKDRIFWKRTLSLCMVIFMLAGFFCLYRLINTIRGNTAGNNFGITMETPVRRAPSYAGEQLFIFREGQPVRILGGHNTPWVWVQANEAGGMTGWIPAQSVIFY